MSHGLSGYTKGCRCDECRTARREYDRGRSKSGARKRALERLARLHLQEFSDLLDQEQKFEAAMRAALR